MSILIKNGKIITMDEARPKIIEGNIYIDGDTIKEISGKEYSADKIIDANGKYILPGLINCHTHLAMSIFRESSDGYDLMSWLNDKIWPAESKLTEEDAYYGTLASCIEMIKTGTTTANDQYMLQNGVIKALKDAKVRNMTTRVLLDLNGRGETELQEFETYYNENKDDKGLVNFSVSPHSLYTCSEKCLKKSLELNKKYNLPVHIHFSENKEEVQGVIKTTGKLPAEYIKEIGLTDFHLILAHGVVIEEKEYEILKNISGGIVHNPISNLRLGCGIANVAKYMQNGILVALGTDGQGSAGNLDLFKTMGITAMLQKGINEDPKIIDSYEVLKMATINGAKMLNMDAKVGKIKEGLKADLIILNLDRIELSPLKDPISQIVYNGTGDMVETTIVNGEVLMENRELNLGDITEKEVKNKIEEIAKRIL